jgi:hypothetical protein
LITAFQPTQVSVFPEVLNELSEELQIFIAANPGLTNKEIAAQFADFNVCSARCMPPSRPELPDRKV